jgi:hypothetical protein
MSAWGNQPLARQRERHRARARLVVTLLVDGLSDCPVGGDRTRSDVEVDKTFQLPSCPSPVWIPRDRLAPDFRGVQLRKCSCGPISLR